MKTLRLFLIVLYLAGAAAPAAALRQGPPTHPDDLSVEEVREVARKLPCLKVGMSLEEVFDSLGEKVRQGETRGSGPTWDFRISHYLWPGHVLLLVWGEGRTFKRAELLGEGWRKVRQESGGREGEAAERCGEAPSA